MMIDELLPLARRYILDTFEPSCQRLNETGAFMRDRKVTSPYEIAIKTDLVE